MSRGLPENRQKWVCKAGFSLLTTTSGVATDLIASGGRVPFPYFGEAMRPEHNHILDQALPLKRGFLSLAHRKGNPSLDIGVSEQSDSVGEGNKGSAGRRAGAGAEGRGRSGEGTRRGR